MIYLNEEEVKALLNWNDTCNATEAALKGVSSKKAVISQRVFSQILQTPKFMITMPGYLEDQKYGAWACKLISSNPENSKLPQPLPAFNASIMLLDENTGILKAVLGGIEITNYRTAAASAVATKYLHTPTGKTQKILSIFGCGEQGRAHANCFYNVFEFKEIRLWNRTTQRAINLAKELNEKYSTTKFKVFEDRESCARGADVILTTTAPGEIPLVKYEWLKKGVHINAVGVVGVSEIDEKHYELDEETYKHAQVFVDDWGSANRELTKLKEYGADMRAEVGEVILGKVPIPDKDQITVFQSLGMAAEDCAMARMIYDLYVQKSMI